MQHSACGFELMPLACQEGITTVIETATKQVIFKGSYGLQRPILYERCNHAPHGAERQRFAWAARLAGAEGDGLVRVLSQVFAEPALRLLVPSLDTFAAPSVTST